MEHGRSSTRDELEELIDQAVADTFPASDPPAWQSLCDRLNRLP